MRLPPAPLALTPTLSQREGGGKTRQRGRYEMLGLNASVNAQKDATGIAAQAAQTAQAVGSDRDFAQRNSGSDPNAGTHPKASKRGPSVSEAI